MQRDGGRADGYFTGELKIIVFLSVSDVSSCVSCNVAAGVSSDPVIALSAVSVRGVVSQRSEVTVMVSTLKQLKMHVLLRPSFQIIRGAQTAESLLLFRPT